LKLKRKALSVLVAMSMLLILLAALAAPAGAYSITHISKIVSIADDFAGATGSVLTIKEDTAFQGDFIAGDSFQLILPGDVNWLSTEDDPVNGFSEKPAITVVGDAYAQRISSQILEVTFIGSDPTEVRVPLNIKVDGAEGDITVVIDAMDSGVTGSAQVFTRVSDVNITVTALSVKTIGDPGWGGDIRIEEASPGSLGSSAQYIRLKLPSHFAWWMTENGTNDPDYQVWFSGGFSGMPLADGAGDNPGNGNYDVVADGSDLYIYFDPLDRTTRGIITVKTPINPDKDAAYGAVKISVYSSIATASGSINTGSPDGTIVTTRFDAPAITLFTVGSMYYTVNGVQRTMDVAPYINADDRALLPVRYAANATGISDSNIFWDASAQSVRLVRNDRTVIVVVGSTTMLINGVESKMDTSPVIADPGRIMLPIRYLAQAFNCDIAWDAATQTITITQPVAVQ
jgi:hypothetical protein